MQRTTRRQSLTDAGRHFYQRAVNQLCDLDEAEQIVSEAQINLSGRIKLAAPLGIGVSQLSKPITEFMQLNTEVNIAVDLIDLIACLIDLSPGMSIYCGQNFQD